MTPDIVSQSNDEPRREPTDAPTLRVVTETPESPTAVGPSDDADANTEAPPPPPPPPHTASWGLMWVW